MANQEKETVLVTGASGFVGMHCVLRLLERGYRVRGTVRNEARAEAVRATLGRYVDVERLSFAYADLDRDEGWSEAVRGCRSVLHVASPVPREPPKNAEEVIGPAREGALRVLRAAAEHRVRRVVMTSSTAAVIWGHARDGSKVYDENDWSVLGDAVGPYERSKTLAERAAWDFVATLPDSKRFELVTLCPGVIFGPLLGSEFSISGEAVRKLLTGELPGCPDLGFAVVDVRDVADAHVEALEVREAVGQRFILALPQVPWLEIARILNAHFSPRGLKVPVRKLPSFVLRCVALFDKTVAVVVPELGKRQDVSNERAKKVLGFAPRSLETAVIDMAESMVREGLVKLPKAAGAVSEASQASV